MATPKTNISFPTFVRFNIYSQNLSAEKQTTALTVSEGITSKNTIVKNLNCTNGQLNCKKDLFVGGNMNITVGANQQANFHGKVNLTNHTIRYTSNFNNNQTGPQQYVSYGRFKQTKTAVAMRSAKSGGHVGWGDVGGWSWNIPWNRFETVVESLNGIPGLSINTRNAAELTFSASASNPKLFRISVVMEKHGGWLDNGTGGECCLIAVVGGREIFLQGCTCSGTSYYRARPMQWIATTYVAKQNGFFRLKNITYSWRAASFSWNVVQLPYFE
ncbi:conserved hypothetical protein [Chlamydia felis Fe/C-56]|uniref:Uncharacterized protein n=1 Tax=Chlamydia felis (strain Fe/C-56) TaxID=264202 RepID=Q254N3_CHLFF|nr:hypothetical protein [Chlamydia felis]BAE81255.1 conserved hypothetical protein [Chlamydia felis Fe/C-56]